MRRNKMRRVSALLAAMMMGTIVAGCSSGKSSVASKEPEVTNESGAKIELASDKILQLGTGGSGGSLYYAGAAIQQGVSETFANLTVASQSTNGSVENLRRMESGDLQLAFTDPSSIAMEAEAGNISAENICLLGAAWDNPWYLVGGVGLPETLTEGLTASTKVGAGEPGSSIQTQMGQVCQVLGLELSSMDKEDIGMSEELTALIDRRLEVGFFGGSAPHPSIEQLAAQLKGGVHLLSWTDEQIEELQELNPFVNAYTVPAGTYTGLDYDAQIPAYNLPLVVRADVDEDTVYELTKYLYTHSEELAKIYPACAHYIPENALKALKAYEECNVQVHPGAVRYYKEIGIMK